MNGERQGLASIRQPLGQSRRRGMSLVELMVSLTIGLFLMAGAMSVFMAASQTGVRKTEADQALEAFRFSQFVLSRVVRQASKIKTSTASSLVLEVPIGVADCLGEGSTSAARENTFDLNAGALRCRVNTGTPQALVENIHSIAFTYGVAASITSQVSFVAAGSVTNWDHVRSVLVTVTAKRGNESGLVTSFVITLRKKALTG